MVYIWPRNTKRTVAFSVRPHFYVLMLSELRHTVSVTLQKHCVLHVLVCLTFSGCWNEILLQFCCVRYYGCDTRKED